MQISSLKNTSPSFGLIKLKPNDLEQSEKLLKIIAEPMLAQEKKNSFAIDLYRIFMPYIKQEARLKAKATYVFEEVFSDIKVKFWEFIYEINDKNVIEDLIKNIDKYKPKKILSKFKYTERSLDEPLPNTKNRTLSENITSEHLPVPQSAIELENIKQKLNTEIKKTKMTETTRQRMESVSRGLTYSEIAKEDKVYASTVRRSVNRGILQIQKRNGLISEENHERISDVANLLGIKFEDALNLAAKHIQILSSSLDVIKRNIENLSKMLGISELEFINIGLKQPILFYQKPETTNKKTEAAAKVFEISKAEFIKIALKRPQLFCQKTETLENNISNFAKIFEISRNDTIKIVLKLPQLFSQKPETINNNVETSAKLFGVTKQEFVKAAIKQLALFYQNPQTLNKNIETTAKLLNILKQDFVKAALKQPQLFSNSPETINKNIEGISKKLKIQKEDYIKAAQKKPQIFSLKSETVYNNVENSAKLLSISKSAFAKAALKQPQLFYQKPETLNSNAETSAKKLGISKIAFVKMGLTQPALFYQKPETLSKKLKIINYYRTLKQEPVKTNLHSRRISTSDEELYKEIFVHLIQKEHFSALNKKDIKINLPDLLDSIQDTVTIEVPKFDFADDFIKYAEKCSIKSTGEKAFKFHITDNK